jgi:hypothetical protein
LEFHDPLGQSCCLMKVETGDRGTEFICSAHTFISKKQCAGHMVLTLQELL